MIPFLNTSTLLAYALGELRALVGVVLSGLGGTVGQEVWKMVSSSSSHSDNVRGVLVELANWITASSALTSDRLSDVAVAGSPGVIRYWASSSQIGFGCTIRATSRNVRMSVTPCSASAT